MLLTDEQQALRAGAAGPEAREVSAPISAADATSRFEFVTLEWARQWPAEEIWKARKRG